MDDKVKVGIERIHLDEATYHGQVVDATAINFFYGRNGSGKSTLTRAIKKGGKIELIPHPDGSFTEKKGSGGAPSQGRLIYRMRVEIPSGKGLTSQPEASLGLSVVMLEVKRRQ